MITNHQTGECDIADCFCHEAQRLRWSPQSPESSWYLKSSDPEPKNGPQGEYGAGMTLCRDCQGEGRNCPYCHGLGRVETYEARQLRLKQSPSTAIPAPDFEQEWRHAPTAHVRYTEKSEAEWWLMRGVWLGIQYERERGLVAMNGDLREMQRMARERITK